VGLLTGSAFPYGGAMMNDNIPFRQNPKDFYKTLICCVALQTAPLNVYLYA
jgi:hypothetical protein